jgi:flagellar motility protein MotE (MotC chaperone)
LMNNMLNRILFSLRIIPALFLAAAFFLGLRLTLLFTGYEGESPFSSSALYAETQSTETEKKPAEEAPKDEGKKEEAKKEEPEVAPTEAEAESAAVAELIAPESLEDDSAFSPQKIALLNQLRKRQEEIERGRELSQNKENVLLAVEKKIDDKLLALDAKKIELEKIAAQVNAMKKAVRDEDNKKIFSLVKIYETMKPKEAARIFEELDLTVLLDVLEHMKEAKTAPILAAMTPEKAKTVTLFLAQKRPLPGGDE